MRHEKKAHVAGVRDHELPLSEQGALQARLFATRFQELGIAPRFFFSSAYRHAIETADVVSSVRASGETTKALKSLTPQSGVLGVQELFDEIASSVFDHSAGSDCLLVVHCPRVHDYTRLFTRREIPKGEGTAVVAILSAASLGAFAEGLGELRFVWRSLKDGTLVEQAL